MRSRTPSGISLGSPPVASCSVRRVLPGDPVRAGPVLGARGPAVTGAGGDRGLSVATRAGAVTYHVSFVHAHARETGWVTAHVRRPSRAQDGRLPLLAVPLPAPGPEGAGPADSGPDSGESAAGPVRPATAGAGK